MSRFPDGIARLVSLATEDAVKAFGFESVAEFDALNKAVDVRGPGFRSYTNWFDDDGTKAGLLRRFPHLISEARP